VGTEGTLDEEDDEMVMVVARSERRDGLLVDIGGVTDASMEPAGRWLGYYLICLSDGSTRPLPAVV
jgi:hypothetical protein